MLIVKNHIVTVGILYWMPDHRHLVQELYFQVNDEVPEIPRVHKFLNFWHDEIEAVIKEVLVAYADQTDWRRII